MAVSQSRDGSNASWLGVGLYGGHAALADPRSGELGAFWKAHEGTLTCLAACSQHLIVTGSQVCWNVCIDQGPNVDALSPVCPGRILQALLHLLDIVTRDKAVLQLHVTVPVMSLQDQTVKLWDTRRLTSPGAMQPLHTYEGHKETVGGLAVHGNDVISWAGSSLGLISLQVINADCLICSP